MLKLYLTLQNLWADKRGVTAIEYAVLAGAVAVALSVLFSDSNFVTALQTSVENAVTHTDPGAAP